MERYIHNLLLWGNIPGKVCNTGCYAVTGAVKEISSFLNEIRQGDTKGKRMRVFL